MARVELAPEIRADFEGILDHLQAYEVADATERLDEIIAALDILKPHPLIGRPVRGALRGLVIGKGSRGYVALYRYIPELETVFVLAIRRQREAGYKRD